MERRRQLGVGCVVALLWLLTACSTAPPPSPTATPAVPATTSTAVAANPGATPAAPATVGGTVDGLAGHTLTVSTSNGARQVQIADDARIEQEGRGSTADLQPGLSVGVTSRADGTAVSIRIFPGALGTPRPGQFPLTGANQGNLMTNSVIQSFDGATLTVSAGSNRYQIRVPPEVEVLKPVPATLADLQAGKRVLAVGMPGPDGSLVATSINIVGTGPQPAP